MPNTPYQQDFWDTFEGDLWDDLSSLLLDVYISGLDGGIQALPPHIRVLTDWDQVNVKALEWAKQYRYDWISKITDTTRKQTQKAMADWIQSGAPLDVLEKALQPIYGQVRAQMIAATEITRIYQTANSESWKATGVVEQVKYQTGVDDIVCPVCRPGQGKIYPIDDTANLPPRHIRCRCYTLPVVSDEAVERRLNEVLNG